MKYNYNVLSVEESRMLKEPFYNDYSIYDTSIVDNKIADAEIKNEQKAGKEVTMDDLGSNIFTDIDHI